MGPLPDPTVTQLLLAFSAGDRRAGERALPHVYDELRRIAGVQLRHERPGQTLSTTDLVHEAYLRLIDVSRVQWQDRAHFYAMAATVMRRLLIDRARARHSARRGAGAVHLSLDATGLGDDLGRVDREEDLLALDEALADLATRSERQARVVECRYFAGLTVEETATALRVSPTTVRTDWRLARAWLFVAMRQGGTVTPP